MSAQIIPFQRPNKQDDDAEQLKRYTARAYAMLLQELPHPDDAYLRRCAEKLARLRMICEESGPLVIRGAKPLLEI